jgi:hypothetical protein
MSDLENKNNLTESTDETLVSTQNVQDDLQELISASATPSTGAEKIDFSVASDQKAKEDKKAEAVANKKIPQQTFATLGYICLVALVGAVVYVLHQFFSYAQTGKVTITQLEKYMPKIEQYYLAAHDTFGISKPFKYEPSVLLFKNLKDNKVAARIIEDGDVDYVGKKKLLQDGATLLLKTTEESYKNLDVLKTEVGQQGYFPREIKSIAPWVFFDNSLQKAIISIESVRFATALKFFSILDSFVGQLSSYTSVDKNSLSTDLQTFIERGEKDINNYIASCYLNGYEISADCSAVGDFTNYYSVLGATGFNQPLFLKTMNALEAKLENTDFPSLEITMQSIDPLKNTISLNVQINTFKDDEAQLTAQQGVLNPHIFIVTNIINHLRESRFVLTDSINVTSLNVAKKKIKVGWQVVVVNASSFTFSFPLQNAVQREIYDFSDTAAPVQK